MSPMSAYDSIKGPVLLSKTAYLFKFSLKNRKNCIYKKSHRMVGKQKMGLSKNNLGFIFYLACWNFQNLHFCTNDIIKGPVFLSKTAYLFKFSLKIKVYINQLVKYVMEVSIGLVGNKRTIETSMSTYTQKIVIMPKRKACLKLDLRIPTCKVRINKILS